MENESSALAVIDAHTGEVVPSEAKANAIETALYIGAAMEPFSSQIQDVLTAPIKVEDLDILPTGEVYASQVRYRRILNEAFGVGGWALIPRDALRLDSKDNYMYRTWALYAHGRYIAEATGEQEYQESNKRMSYASAAEGVKSNALTRCCKDLGIASECWDRRFTEDFKKAHCVQVWCDKRKQWRRKDAEPFWNETGFVAPRKANSQLPSDENAPPARNLSNPNEKASLEQRKALVTAAVKQLGDKSTEWLKAKFKELGYKSREELTIGGFTTLMKQLAEMPDPARGEEPQDDGSEALAASFDREAGQG